MTVRQVIAALEKAADGLPQGLDAKVMLIMCMDEEVSVTSMELEVSRIHLIADDGSGKRMALPMLKGHTHVDRDKGNLGGILDVKDDADDVLRQWTEEDDGQ